MEAPSNSSAGEYTRGSGDYLLRKKVAVRDKQRREAQRQGHDQSKAEGGNRDQQEERTQDLQREYTRPVRPHRPSAPLERLPQRQPLVDEERNDERIANRQ